MAVTAPLRVDRVLTPDGKFQLTMRLVDPDGIQEEVFLVLTNTDQFVRICVLADFRYPVGPTPGQQYHRRAEVSKVFDSLEAAEQAESDYQSALQSLVNTYEAGVGDFNNSSTTYVITAP